MNALSKFLRDYYIISALVAMISVYVVSVSIPTNWAIISSVRQELQEKVPTGAPKSKVIAFLRVR